MKPVYMSNKKHPLDNPMFCPKCNALTYPDHYDDGEPVEIGSLVDNENFKGQNIRHEVTSTCYTPMWLCMECLHTWDIKDIK